MILPAIILNEPYADYVKIGKKIIETRMRLFTFSGDIVICCDKGKSKGSKNAGNCLCVVYWTAGRPMIDEDAEGACIENVPGRYAFPLSNRRLFSYDFKFTDYAIGQDGRKPNWQGIFSVRIPDFVTILPVEETSDVLTVKDTTHA